MDKRETRVFPLTGVEFRDDGDKLHFRGEASVFNKLSEPLWGFREQVAPSAFDKTIKEGDVRFLQNHNPDLVLARSKMGRGTLSLSTNSSSLIAETDMAPTSYARDLSTVMQRGDIDQMSFGFQVVKEAWDESDPSNVVRTLQEVRLFDVSVVTFPAYPQTTAEVRSLIAGIQKRTGVRAIDLDGPKLDAVAAALQELRAGRVLSAANEQVVRDAIANLQGLLDQLEQQENDEQQDKQDPDPAESGGRSLLDAERRSRRLKLLQHAV